MSDYRTGGYAVPAGRVNAQAVDQGLRSYMLAVYQHMAVGVAITGLAAYLIFTMATTVAGAPDAVGTLRGGLALTEFGRVVFVSPLKWVLMLAPIGLVFLMGFRIQSMAPTTARMLFWLYAGLVGFSVATAMMVFTGQSVARVFFISAATFGALALYGYTTRKSLSGMGSFLMMGLFGLIIASLVNIFLQSSALQFALSAMGVLIFAGLTAYDTQRLKEEYIYSLAGGDEATIGRQAIMGALTLYLDFINLFMSLLQLLGDRR